jgi:hypothetical protein
MAALISLFLPIAAWTVLCRRTDTRAHWLGAWAWAAPMAIGSSSVVWWGLMQLGIESQQGLIAADTGVWLAAIGVVLLRRQGARCATFERRPVSHDHTRWILFAGVTMVLALAAISFAADAAVEPHGDWDAWAIWNLRARFLYRGYPAYWKDGFSPLLGWSHVDYPLLVPLSVARGWTFAGRESTVVPAVFAALFALGIVVAAAVSVGRARGRARGALAGAAILACPAFVKYSSSQCADVPLAFFILATFVAMFRAFESPPGRSAWLMAGASAGLAAWTKNEGLLFLVVFVTVAAIGSCGSGKTAGLKCAGRLLLGALPMIVALMALKALAPGNDLLHAQSAESLVTAFGSLDRVATVAAGVGQALWFGGAGAVGVLPIIAAFGVVVGLDRPANPAPMMALIAMVLLIAGYAGVYALTPHDLEWQMKTSLDRVMLHAFPTLVWSGLMLARK